MRSYGCGHFEFDLDKYGTLLTRPVVSYIIVENLVMFGQ